METTPYMNPHLNEEAKTLITISLLSESFSKDFSKDINLGLINILTKNVPCLSLTIFREKVIEELFDVTPGKFLFSTQHGAPIHKNQEEKISVEQILTAEKCVRLLKCYEKPRIGVKCANGQAIGFFFSEYSTTLSEARSIIQNEMGQIVGDQEEEYQFLDRNGWPVSNVQEEKLTVMDLLVDGSIRFCPQMFSIIPSSNSCPDGVADVHEEPNSHHELLPENPAPTNFVLNQPTKKRSSKVAVWDILISYVRKEAFPFAKHLKAFLKILGFTVFLDLDELCAGHDWIDMLNKAVINCRVFVPLVTSQYGETQWSNREIKLADKKGRLIVPVNFLRTWPPDCLAIQCASMQYITAKHTEAYFTGEPCIDEMESIAKKIGETLEAKENSSFMQNKRISTIRSFPGDRCDGQRIENTESVSYEHREGTPLVVICLHKNDIQYGMQQKK